jgi:NifU-like protein involved in Fe-S cluster formation
VSAYSEAVLDHFRNPRGAGRLPLDAPGTVRGEARSADGGERVRLFLRIDDGDRIACARFQAFGCPVAIAASSAAVAHFEGASVRAALALDAGALAHELSLTDEQAALAELPLQALRDGLAYLRARP